MIGLYTFSVVVGHEIGSVGYFPLLFLPWKLALTFRGATSFAIITVAVLKAAS